MRTAGWYAARLRAMSAREVASRAARAVRLAVLRLASRRPHHTLPPGPVPTLEGPAHRIRYFDVELDYPRPEGIDWSRDYKNGVSAPLEFYGDIDHRDEAQVGDSKYTWELNRHQFIVPWALEYAQGRDERHAAAVVALILDWIEANPRYWGINWSSSLEVALRLLSWGIADDLCRPSAWSRAAHECIEASVTQQADYIAANLSSYSSANNHLTGELIGLLAAAAYFPQAERVQGHARLARTRLEREALRQNHADGVNREQAIYYHHYAVEYLLTAAALYPRLGWTAPTAWEGLLRRMLEFVDSMTDDQGHPFAIGDADDGTVTGLNQATGVGVYESLLWSGWWLYREPGFGSHAARIARACGRVPAIDRRTAYWYPDATLGSFAENGASSRRRTFPRGGYIIRADGEYTLLFKAGPFGYPSIAAHAHCDQLSVCLRRDDCRILTDAGTYAYHTHERWRRFFRGTSAHNTVRVDGQDQALFAGPFLWSTRAEGTLEVMVDDDDRLEARGLHDGYRRLPDPVGHEREVAYRAGLGYRIRDRLQGARSHLFELFWNFGPQVAPRHLSGEGKLPGLFSSAWIVYREERPVLGLLVTCDSPFEGHLHFGDESIPAGFESRRYLEKIPAHQLRLAASAPACCFSTYLVPARGHTAALDLFAAPSRWA